jgi:hypothetical protein
VPTFGEIYQQRHNINSSQQRINSTNTNNLNINNNNVRVKNPIVEIPNTPDSTLGKISCRKQQQHYSSSTSFSNVNNNNNVYNQRPASSNEIGHPIVTNNLMTSTTLNDNNNNNNNNNNNWNSNSFASTSMQHSSSGFEPFTRKNEKLLSTNLTSKTTGRKQFEEHEEEEIMNGMTCNSFDDSNRRFRPINHPISSEQTNFMPQKQWPVSNNSQRL